MLRTNVEISWNKTSFFPSAGRGFTTLLRLGLGLCLVWQACPQVGLVSAFCACPPTFALDFLHPRPRGRKLVLNFWVPPNWPRGDLHSRADVMSSVPNEGPRISAGPRFAVLFFRVGILRRRPSRSSRAPRVLRSRPQSTLTYPDPPLRRRHCGRFAALWE